MSYTSPISNLPPADWLPSIGHHDFDISSAVQGVSWTSWTFTDLLHPKQCAGDGEPSWPGHGVALAPKRPQWEQDWQDQLSLHAPCWWKGRAAGQRRALTFAVGGLSLWDRGQLARVGAAPWLSHLSKLGREARSRSQLPRFLLPSVLNSGWR